MSIQTPEGTPIMPREEFSSEQKQIDDEDRDGKNFQHNGSVVDNFHDSDFFEHRNVDDILHRCVLIRNGCESSTHT